MVRRAFATLSFRTFLNVAIDIWSFLDPQPLSGMLYFSVVKDNTTLIPRTERRKSHSLEMRPHQHIEHHQPKRPQQLLHVWFIVLTCEYNWKHPQRLQGLFVHICSWGNQWTKVELWEVLTSG